MNEPLNNQSNPYPPRTAGPGAYPGNQNGPYPPPSYVPPNYQYQVLKPFSTYAILSMIMGGAGILLAPLGALSGPLGVLFGWLGIRESREQDGTHRGRGLAIGGMVVSVLALLISAALIVFFIWFFSFVNDQIQRESPTGILMQRQYLADEDLELFEDRLRLYYVENLRSFGPGGPQVRDTRFGDRAISELPGIEGELKISDLVDSSELNYALTDYTLEVLDENRASVTCRAVSRQLRADYSTSRDYDIGGIRENR